MAKRQIPFHVLTGRILPANDGPTGLLQVQLAIREMARVLFTIRELRRRGLNSFDYELPQVRLETVNEIMGSLQLARTECRSAGIEFSVYDPTLTEAKRIFFDGLSRIPEAKVLLPPANWPTGPNAGEVDNLIGRLNDFRCHVEKTTQQRDAKVDERNQWIYKKRCDPSVQDKNIVTELKRIAKSKGWDPIRSIQGVRAAAERYAKSHKKPLPPSRHNL